MYEYFRKTSEELGMGAKIEVLKLGDSGEVFYEMAIEMINAIKENNSSGKNTVFICPVGPVGQYPIFVRLVNRDNISLKKTWFINMDEYLDDEQQWINIEDKLSFRGYMNREVYSKIKPELLMPEEQRIFPDPNNINYVPELIEKLAGVDICFGGIGINGHIAFNEPEDLTAEEFARLTTRVLVISRETRTINSVGDLNGAIAAMPKYCVTIGMKEILAARKIRLYCFRDWHRAVVRQAVYGEVSASFPVTLVQNHPDVRITINSNAAQKPF
jgi:glucosamine-6-phosphate deaminase